MQDWRHHFAWTERTKNGKLADRQRLVPEQQQDSMRARPMFCFETAIKLLYWCALVYELDEVSLPTIYWQFFNLIHPHLKVVCVDTTQAHLLPVNYVQPPSKLLGQQWQPVMLCAV